MVIIPGEARIISKRVRKQTDISVVIIIPKSMGNVEWLVDSQEVSAIVIR